MSASTEFAMGLPFLGYRQRNAVLDNFFYDTASLTLEERAKLTPRRRASRAIQTGRSASTGARSAS